MDVSIKALQVLQGENGGPITRHRINLKLKFTKSRQEGASI